MHDTFGKSVSGFSGHGEPIGCDAGCLMNNPNSGLWGDAFTGDKFYRKDKK